MLDLAPTAWMRLTRAPDTAHDPGELIVDFSYGDDPPEPTGWVPLYQKAEKERWLDRERIIEGLECVDAITRDLDVVPHGIAVRMLAACRRLEETLTDDLGDRLGTCELCEEPIFLNDDPVPAGEDGGFLCARHAQMALEHADMVAAGLIDDDGHPLETPVADRPVGMRASDVEERKP